MKKILFLLLLFFYLCNPSRADEFYFNNCKISPVVTGNYIINLEKNTIDVILQTPDQKAQIFSDKIKLIEKDKIISEKIKSIKGKNAYYQYILNAKLKSVTKLEYEKETGEDIVVYNLYDTRVTHCSNIKAGWDTRKIDEEKLTKEQKQILKAKEQIKKEQNKLIECQGENFNQWHNCEGSYLAETGHKYDGIFKNGKILKGISIYPGGAKYVGDFKNFKPHGFGTFVWANGDKYYGEWKNGKNEGNGTKIWKNGRKYLGTFKEDKLHGRGTLFYPDGKKYEGEFINGVRHGEGIFTYSDGTAYIGQFLSGKEEGEGECVSKDGKSIPCKSKTETQAKDFTGRDTRNISIVAKKWIRLSHYEENSKKGKKIMDKLKSDFDIKAKELCISKGSYNILEKKLEVLEIDETPAYGLEPKLKIAINGVVECKKI
tara:strand:- start:264 stop:1553 length:1290 start_codon:yes stop_codon:yes gene_type:complete